MTGSHQTPHIEPLLQCNALTVRYDSSDCDALSAVTLAVHPGEIVGLVGRNGAGKSTLIRATAGLQAFDSGHVRVAGLDPCANRLDVMRVTGFLLAETALFGYLTTTETLALVADLHGYSPGDAKQRIEEMIDLVELVDARHRRVSTFSTGMSKRLALACALLPSPRLLVLDEPFESLDPLVVRRLSRAIGALRDNGVGVLLSSHLLGTVSGLCDRVVLLERGRVLADGPVSALIAAHAPADEPTLEGAYAALVESV